MEIGFHADAEYRGFGQARGPEGGKEKGHGLPESGLPLSPASTPATSPKRALLGPARECAFSRALCGV